MDMTDHEHGETMRGNSAAPLGCPKISVFPCSSQDGGNQVQAFTDIKVEFGGQSSHGSRDLGKLVLRESLGPPNKEPNRSLCNQELCKSPNICPEQIQHNTWGLLENHFYPIAHEYPRPTGDRVQYVPFNMFSPGYPRGYQLQEFQYFVVIDFEATCDKEQIPQPQEIIEFPSVLVNSITGQLEASFQTYVRPAYHQVLTDFCKNLTGIQQIQVDRGVSLSEALLMHDRWLEQKGIKHTNFAVVTWSNWDCRVMLESECRLKRIRKPPYFNRWINLKIPFNEVFGGVRCNLKQAVQLAGLSWEGRAHCGLDDACNTARLLALLMCRGFRFSITNSLMWQSADHSTIWQPSTDQPSGTISSFQKQTQLPGHPPHFHPVNKERHTYCFCGVMSSKCIVRKPGPKYGRFFFGCGNWTVTRGALCPYFEWAS